ncbi:L-threonylcarbamoyladenylate synthase [Accumulibacter sp.]|uniref:L-threonylcarbamoyladenylate synthase n=1 Tax=Accumulibacter sp. TaxID=2053492 RepID=UPI0015996F90|nr:MAG: threonylcarbamoyl-AMP synthase [Candidatus Accumulibacter similis]
MPPEATVIDHAVALLQAGELVAFPTETVYGLGADAANPAAVGRIFAAKGRPADHPLIVHLPADGYLDNWASDIPRQAWELTEAFWPGPLTLILRRGRGVPGVVTGGQETIGLRVPAHPLALTLLRAFAEAGGGLGGLCGVAAPSANRFGRISPTEAAHVRAELGESVRLILDGGRCAVGIESTIIDLSRGAGEAPRLLRPGAITPEQIATVIGRLPAVGCEPRGAGAEAVPRVPGALAAHYAPATPMRLLPATEIARLAGTPAAGRCHAVLCHSQMAAAEAVLLVRRLPADPAHYAHELYAALRELDQSSADLILVEDVPATAAWSAIADRLQRAASGAGGSAKSPSLEPARQSTGAVRCSAPGRNSG